MRVFGVLLMAFGLFAMVYDNPETRDIILGLICILLGILFFAFGVSRARRKKAQKQERERLENLRNMQSLGLLPRQGQRQTTAPKPIKKVIKCPSCGAEQEIIGTGICEYCGNPLTAR